MRVNWVLVLDQARAIVEEYDTPVTLRQLFYRLVAAQEIPNLQSFYRRLSAQTAEARRNGTFPDLADETSGIRNYTGWDSPAQALRLWSRSYHRDRTEGQPVSLVVGVEKAGLINQLSSWFGDRMTTIVPTGGFTSQTDIDTVVRGLRRRDRPAVLLYAGDHDPSGHDIERDFIKRTGGEDTWEVTRRIALTPEQVIEYGLPEYAPTPAEMAKLENDPRARTFEQRYGSLVQYEVDAVPPDVLRGLFADAIAEWWDDDTGESVLVREAEERDRLKQLADEWADE